MAWIEKTFNFTFTAMLYAILYCSLTSVSFYCLFVS